MSHDIDGRHNLVVLCLFCKSKSLIPLSHICKTEKIIRDTLDDASCISKDKATVYNGLPRLHKLNNIQITFIKAKQRVCSCSGDVINVWFILWVQCKYQTEQKNSAPGAQHKLSGFPLASGQATDATRISPARCSQLTISLICKHTTHKVHTMSQSCGHSSKFYIVSWYLMVLVLYCDFGSIHHRPFWCS